MGDAVCDWSLTDGKLHWLKSGPSAEAKSLGECRDLIAWQNLIHPDDLAMRIEAINRHLSQRQDHHACEYRLRLPGCQETIWVEERGSAEWDDCNRPVRMILSLRVISARKEQEQHLNQLAHFDELTGLYNLPHLRQALDHALAFAKRRHSHGLYLVIGIDNLSLINNALGTAAADTVIIEVAQRLQTLLSHHDIMGRVGGDHFGIIVNQPQQRAIGDFLDSILQAVNSTTIATAHGDVGVTVSIGTANFITDGHNAHDLMARAEIALQAAKRSGRNCVIQYRSDLQPLLANHYSLGIAEEVRAALRYGRFCLAFQPMINAKTGHADFYECLARIRREDGTLLPAGAFIQTAEQMGLMREIDNHIARLAVYELRKDPSLRLAINLSAHNVGVGPWLQHLQELLAETPTVGERLMVEITETAALADPQLAKGFVETLRGMGCLTALDDFGAGYTSYRQLRMLPVQMVKIDGSFAKDIATNIGNQLFVRTLVELANGFGLTTIAEGVETAEDAELLRQFGVTLLQGYYFAKPGARETLRVIEGTAIEPEQVAV